MTLKVAGESVLAVAMPVPSAVDFDASGFAKYRSVVIERFSLSIHKLPGKTVIANGDALILSDLRRTVRQNKEEN